MLGTTIVATALTTGDTMSHTIRGMAVRTLGQTDELVSAKGTELSLGTGLGSATGVEYFDEDVVQKVDAAIAGTNLVDGVTPAIIEQIAVQAPEQRQTEPRVTLFAADPERMEGFGPSRGATARSRSTDLAGSEVYLNADAAEELGVAPGDRILLYAGGPRLRVTVKDVVRYEGAGTADSALFLPLEEAQAFLGRPGQVRHVLISNRGDEWSGAGLSDEVVQQLGARARAARPRHRHLQARCHRGGGRPGEHLHGVLHDVRHRSLIAAGVLLIFLVFVMLATERRGELGIARAIGTRRSHLVQTFTFEGAAYDLLAALAGALFGAAVAYLMVVAMAQAFDAATGGSFEIEFAVTPRSLAIAYALGVLLTLGVVAVSAWRVSTMTISAAIRNLPEPKHERRRRRLALAAAGLALGGLLTLSGIAGNAATPLMTGISLILVSLVPILQLLGVSERIAYTACGLTIVGLLLLPWRLWEEPFGPTLNELLHLDRRRADDRRRGRLGHRLQRRLAARRCHENARGVRSLAPVLKISMAYPLANRFRTGATLAMFTLVVFTLVTGIALERIVHARA